MSGLAHYELQKILGANQASRCFGMETIRQHFELHLVDLKYERTYSLPSVALGRETVVSGKVDVYKRQDASNCMNLDEGKCTHY